MIVKIHPIDETIGFHCSTDVAEKLRAFIEDIGPNFLCCTEVSSGQLGLSYVEYGLVSVDDGTDFPEFSFCLYEEGDYEFLSYEEIMLLFSGVFLDMRRRIELLHF